jgi:uncharacterized protein (UPF0276 family)
MVPVGFALQPDEAFLDRLGDVLENDVDYYEVAPETLWAEDARGNLQPNGFASRFARIAERTRKPFVAHGVGLSMGTSARRDAKRRRAFLERVRRDHAVFHFRWYTDHLGASSLDGRAVTLPIALPMTTHAAEVVRARLLAMQRIVPDVGVENNVAYFLLGDPLEEPTFLQRILTAPRTHLLLDLHNLFTMSQNLSFDPEAYVRRLDLGRVIEIHLSGGSASDPGWLPSGRVLRLDSHDAAVPEAVWRLYEEVAPRCPRLRGVTVERMEGTVEDRDVPLLRGELRRARSLARRLG